MKLRKDIDGRKPKNVIRDMARDMLRGARFMVTYRSGKQLPVCSLKIRAGQNKWPHQKYLIELECYDLEPNELFSDQIILWTDQKTYWRGFFTSTH